MSDNTTNRLHDTFFYGLYMVPEILEKCGVDARNPRKAYVENFELCIGNKATLLRSPGKKAFGIIYSLTHDEINQLYWGAGLTEYRSEALIATREDGNTLAVLCCNLLTPPADGESNPEYAEKLEAAMQNLGLPF